MTTVPQSVLVAVDFSEASGRAVALGGVIADRCGAVLRLLHAETTDVPPYFTPAQVEPLERQQQATRAQVEQALSQFGRQHTHRAFSSVVDGRSPVDAILHEAGGVDLVVVGTHGRSGPKRWWLGSVAERVLHETDRPLLIVHAEGGQPADSLFDRVLVHAAAPLDGTTTLDYARALTARFRGEVIDGRHGPIEPTLASTDATLLIVAAPHPRTRAWLLSVGEPFVRRFTVPVLFVPELTQGAM
ncbi:MAG: universal stress protein [Acidobacteriota bacterium]